MKIGVIFFGHKHKIFSAIVQTVSIYVMDYHIIRAMSDLPVHPYHKLFVIRFNNSVGITVVAGPSYIPGVRCDSGGIFVIDNCSS